jgi:hypothetical protein
MKDWTRPRTQTFGDIICGVTFANDEQRIRSCELRIQRRA